jgi:catechol 2,3-dioxygenase-like lactoylglutathione lyase family enzyme
MISKVSLATIPVKDQDRALKFYTEKLGFKVDVDLPFGEHQRWIELIIPGADTRVALFTCDGQQDRIGTFSNISFGADDAYKTYEELSKKGVEFTQKPEMQSWGGVLGLFKDPDGNTFCLISCPKA